MTQGPRGIPAFAILAAPFVMPAIGTLGSGPFVTVSVGSFPDGTLSSSQWAPVGSTVAIAGAGTGGQAGYMLVASVPSGGTMQLVNNGSGNNVAAGVTVPAGGTIGAGGALGAPGPSGPAPATVLRTAFAMPASAAQTGTLAFDSTAFFVIGQSLQIPTAGRMVIFSIADPTHAVLTNPGDPLNAAPTTNIAQPANVGVSGAIGPTGAGTTGPAGPAPAGTGLVAVNAGTASAITPSQDVVISPTTGVASVQGATIPASVTAPKFAHLQALAGAGQIMRYWSQAAAAGAVANGGDVSFLQGKRDGAVGGTLQLFWWGEALTTDFTQVNEGLGQNYYNLMRIFRNAANNVNLNIGGGNNNAGGGVSSVEISSSSPTSIATESVVNFTSTYSGDASVTIGPGLFANIDLHTAYNFRTNLDNSPLLQVGSSVGNALNGSNGYVNFDWEGSSVHQSIASQHAATASGNDFELLSRWLGLLVVGSYSENNAIHAADTMTLGILKSTGSGVVIQAQSPTLASTQTQLAVAADALRSIVHGDTLAGSSDCRIWQMPTGTNTSSTTAGQVIATIAPRGSGTTNVVSQLVVRVTGLCQSTGDWTSALLSCAVRNTNGVLSLGTGAPAAQDIGHSVTAGAMVAAFAISGSNITVQVTPWVATLTHWTVTVEHAVNMGVVTVPALPTPAALLGVTPTFYWRADLVGTGALATLVDQSTSGHTFNSSGTQATNTANAGPSGAQNGLVLPGNGYYTLANGLGIGAVGWVIGAIYKATNPASGGSILEIGQSSGVQFGIGVQGTSSRDLNINRFGAGQINGSAGLGTTSWESAIFGCDAQGRLSCLISGAPQAVTPMATGLQGILATANSSIAGATPSTNKFVGTLFELDVFNSGPVAVNMALMYALHHAVTGGAV